MSYNDRRPRFQEHRGAPGSSHLRQQSRDGDSARQGAYRDDRFRDDRRDDRRDERRDDRYRDRGRAGERDRDSDRHRHPQQQQRDYPRAPQHAPEYPTASRQHGRDARNGHADDARDRMRSRSPSRSHPNQHRDHDGTSQPKPSASAPAPAKSALKREASPVLEDYDFDLTPEEQQAKLIEERRKRRQAILAKHKEGTTPTTGTPSAVGSKAVSAAGSERGASEAPTPAAERTRSVTPNAAAQQQPEDFSLAKKEGEDAAEATTAAGDDADVSAADYDPMADRALDDERQNQRFGAGGGGEAEVKKAAELAEGTGEAPKRVAPAKAAEESEYEEIEVDDDDDVEDMFALGDDDEEKPKKKKVIRVKKGAKAGEKAAVTDAPALLDNWDDEEGYYRIVLGERLGEGGRYHVFANLGKGMFSSVVKARDTGPPDAKISEDKQREVAIKVVRIQETMYKAGLKEINVLRKLASLDPDDKKHIIRLVGHFEHRGHLCMVFESLSMNLREVVKRFGKSVGLNLRAVRAYAHQMFLALSLMRKAEVMHADIKPDNILVNDAKNVIKVCDLGSASDLSEMEITPYLVSRFYRAPEIILGQPYDCALDMWSIGCTLYELATGKILFPGRSNNHMLLLMQELRGKFTTKQIRKGRFSGMHFDEQNMFMSLERDKNTGQEVLRKVALSKPVSDLRQRILPGNTASRMPADELRLTNNFVNLLERTLELDPSKRISPKEALMHPFFGA